MLSETVILFNLRLSPFFYSFLSFGLVFFFLPSRGIEWLSLSCFLSFSHPNPGSSGLVRNEVLVLDLQTGQATHLRENKGEEPPIEAAKVSHLK